MAKALSKISEDEEPHKDHENFEGFMLLPRELRDKIYDYALIDIFEAPENQASTEPWDPTPSNARFKTYTSLRLVNRRVSEEATDRWTKLNCEESVVLYFDNVATLYKKCTQALDQPFLTNARFDFRLYTSGHSGDERYERATNVRVRECSALLKSQWGMLRENADPAFSFLYSGPNSDGLVGEGGIGEKKTIMKRESVGYGSWYWRVEFPQTERGLELRLYRGNSLYRGLIVLQGRLNHIRGY